MNSKNIDSNLTIILVIKDRVDCTYRWMEYADLINFPFKIIIVDGGLDKKIEKILSDSESYKNISYNYYRCPYDETLSEYYAKLAFSFEHVNTDYVALADNDDFLIIDGLRRSTEFLMRHPDYSSCRGLVGEVFIKNKSNFEFKVNRDIVFDIDYEKAVDRVKTHLSDYDITFYDVHRTKELGECFRKLDNLNPYDVFIAEILTSTLTVTFGKIKRNNYLYLIRHQNNSESVALKTNKANNFYERMFLYSWSNDCNNFINTIADSLTLTQGEIDKKDAINIVRDLYRKFIMKYITPIMLSNATFSRIVMRKLLALGNVVSNRRLISFFSDRLYTVLFKVKFKNGKATKFSKLSWLHGDVVNVAKVIKKHG